jgi:HK97 family phage portal protein
VATPARDLTPIRSTLARWLGRSTVPVPGAGGPINPTMEGAIPVGWPVNYWQRNLRPGGGGESATVNACVNAYAQTIAQLPGGHFSQVDGGEPKRITTSPLSRLLRWPNDYQTRSDFMLNAVTDIMFTGNAYAWAERDDRQEVAALHLMPARSTTPYVDPESRAIFYALGNNPTAGRIDYLVPARDVLHIRGRTRLGDPLRGVSPITWAAMAQAANVAISGTQAQFFGNASQPSGVLVSEQPLTAEQMKRLREAWREHAAGVAAGDVPILGGGLKWVPMGITAQDSELVEAFGMTVADIARAFGVPLPIIGDLSNATFNNVEQLIALWLSTGLGFWVEHIETAFDKFFALPANQFVELDTDTLLRTAFKDRIDGLTAAITGGLYSPNEGLGDVDFGDEPRVQAQVVPLSQVDKTPPAASAPAGGLGGGAPPPPPLPANDADEAATRAVAPILSRIDALGDLVAVALDKSAAPPAEPDPEVARIMAREALGRALEAARVTRGADHART